MKTLHPSSQYKKDLKRIKNNAEIIEKLMSVLKLLLEDMPFPDIYSPPLLTGDYSGYMECHIMGDLLLIWIDPETDQIDLIRLGSHSELFGKGKKR